MLSGSDVGAGVKQDMEIWLHWDAQSRYQAACTQYKFNTCGIDILVLLLCHSQMELTNYVVALWLSWSELALRMTRESHTNAHANFLSGHTLEDLAKNLRMAMGSPPRYFLSYR